MMGLDAAHVPNGSGGSSDAIAANDVGGLLPDHDGRGISVGTADLRHDGTVAHPETIETVNAELRRNH